MHIGMRIDWWGVEESISPSEEGEYVIEGIWPISTRLKAIHTSSAKSGSSLFLVRDGLRVGMGTYPSQGCVEMHLEEATEDKLGCNDLLPGELALIRAAYEACKDELPEY